MAYLTSNPPSKAEAKRRLASGKVLEVFQPGLGTVPLNGTIAIEGPHYPKPHSWYGIATIKDGIVVAIK